MRAWNEEIKEGDIVVVTVESTSPEYSAFGRAFVCNGKGVGTSPKCVGTAIFGKWLDGTGGVRIERRDISTVETLAFREGVAYASAQEVQGVKYMLSRLYKAALRYYFLKEIGEPESAVEAAKIRSELFSALPDISLTETAHIEGKWCDAGQICFDLKKGTLRYESPGDEDVEEVQGE